MIEKLLSEKRLEEINNITKNPDKRNLMIEISEKILSNGYDMNPQIYKNKKLKDLKVLKKTLNQFYSLGGKKIDEEMINSINSLKATNKINKKIELMSKEEQIILLSSLYEKNENEIIYILQEESPEKKIELLNKYIDDEVFDEEVYLKKQNETKLANILRELSLFETQKEKRGFLRFLKERENKPNSDPIYNKQLHDMLKDNKISRLKQDFLKHAYFKKGLDIEEFKKNLGTEFYNCSEAQLENYVTLWDKYQDNLISRDDFYFGKKMVFKQEISQEAIEETLIPILQENTLSKKEIEECINVSYNKSDEFFEEITKLTETLKENNYSQGDIYQVIKDSKDDSVEKLKEEIKLINELPDNSIDVNKIDNLSIEEIKTIREEKLNVLDKSKTDLETDMELDFFKKKNYF